MHLWFQWMHAVSWVKFDVLWKLSIGIAIGQTIFNNMWHLWCVMWTLWCIVDNVLRRGSIELAQLFSKLLFFLLYPSIHGRTAIHHTINKYKKIISTNLLQIVVIWICLQETKYISSTLNIKDLISAEKTYNSPCTVKNI